MVIILTAINFSAFAQATMKKQKATVNADNMNTEILTNITVKSAFEAWQKGDRKMFLLFFTTDAKLYDDGSPRDFERFVKDACGNEKFTSIDKVENNGLAIFGTFHTKSWGDFKTYFKFHINAEGKLNRLDIGQAN